MFLMTKMFIGMIGNRKVLPGIRLWESDKNLVPRWSVYIERRRQSAISSMESKLTASLAHEINNPLDCVLNLLYLVEREASLTEKGRQYLSQAAEEVRRVSQIAQAALTQSRDCTVREVADVPGIVNSTIELYKSRFEERGISVSTRYCAHGEFSVFPGPLRQVFSNLLLNASDAMPKGGRLHARAYACREWSGHQRRGMRITIADNGSGIDKRHLREVFEPFFTTKGSGGSGMGLYLVTEVVRKHGGCLRVRSSTKPGRSGTVFTVFLPDQDQLLSAAS